MMNITFAMDGMRMTYLDGLPDMTKVKGSATVLATRSRARSQAARIGTV